MNSPAPLSPSGQRAPTSSPRSAAHLLKAPLVEVYLPSAKYNQMSQYAQTSFLSSDSSNTINSAVDDSFSSSSCFSPEKAGSASEVCFLYRQALEQHVLPSLVSLECIGKRPPQTAATTGAEEEEEDFFNDDDDDDISDCMSIFSSTDLDSVVAAAEAAAANPSMDSNFFCDDADSVVIRRRQRQSLASNRDDDPSSHITTTSSSSFHFTGMESIQPRVVPSNYNDNDAMDEDDMESLASSVDTIYSFDLDHHVHHNDSDANRRRTI